MAKIGSIKLPTVRWSIDWAQDLNWKLTQIIQTLTYTLNQFSDGYIYPTTSVTATYSANVGDTIILADGTFTVTLPIPSKCKNKRFVVKNSGIGTITIVGASGTIDGAANVVLSVTMEAVDLVSDGSGYWIV